MNFRYMGNMYILSNVHKEITDIELLFFVWIYFHHISFMVFS